MLPTITATDDRYAGSMKLAAIVDRLTAICPAPGAFDPDSLYAQIHELDERLPGSRKLAAIVYLMTQLAVAPHFLDSGVATLVAGAATVASPLAHSTRTVLLSYFSLNGSISCVGYNNVVDGVGFDILSSFVGDTNQVAWAIIG